MRHLTPRFLLLWLFSSLYNGVKPERHGSGAWYRGVTNQVHMQISRAELQWAQQNKASRNQRDDTTSPALSVLQ